MARRQERAPTSIEGLLNSRLIAELGKASLGEGPEVVADSDGFSYKVSPKDNDFFSVVRYHPGQPGIKGISLESKTKTIEVAGGVVSEEVRIRGGGYFVPSVVARRAWEVSGDIKSMEVLYELGAVNKDLAGFEYNGDENGMVLAGRFKFSNAHSGTALAINASIDSLPGRITPGFRMGELAPDLFPVKYSVSMTMPLLLSWKRDLSSVTEEIWSKGGFEEIARIRHAQRSR